MPLQAQRSELERLQFKIVKESDDSIIAFRKKWHWDCLFTRLTYVVFVRKVAKLDLETIERDRNELSGEAKRLDSPLIPRGFQKGFAVLTFYLAETIDDSARERLTTKPKVRFAFFYLPSALDQKTGKTYYLQDTPIWGYIYYGKFRYLTQRLLNPASPTGTEPFSPAGIGITVFICFILLLEAGIIFALLK